MDTLKTQAIHCIKHAHYDGEKKDFGIAKYYTIHTSAQNDLAEAGEPMTDSVKITNCCNGIKDVVAVNYAITTKSEPTVNNNIYLGNDMEDSLLCPNQCRANGIEIDTTPKIYCENDETAESIYCPEINKRFPIWHHGALPFLPVQKPTIDGTLLCSYIDLTPDSEWDPYGSNSPTSSGISKVALKSLKDQGIIGDDPQQIGQVLMGQNLDSIFSKQKLIHSFQAPGEEEFCSFRALSARKKNKLSPEELSKLWRIGLKAARRKLSATIHTCIRTVGNLT